MKKLLSIALALTLMFVFMSGCSQQGGGSSSSAASGGTAGEDQTFTIGICQLIQHEALDAATKGFRDAVSEALGDRVTFDEQNAQGDSPLCSTIVGGFVANEYDLIMANATPALQAAVSATSTIPVLGVSVTDFAAALEMDFDSSKGSGINVSGASDGVPGQMYVDLLMELFPEAKNVSVLFCSAEPNSLLQAEDFKASLPEGVDCSFFTFADSNDIQAVTTAAIENCDVLYIPTDNQAAANVTIIRNVTEPAGIPVIAGEEGICKGCGLATVSISYYNIGRVCGEMAVSVLTGEADITTLAIAYDQAPVRKINQSYADAIGFAVPEGFENIE